MILQRVYTDLDPCQKVVFTSKQMPDISFF
jgi:hypothetical protein